MNIYNSKRDKIISFFFILIPIIFVILGLLFFPDFTEVDPYFFLPIPNFIGMILLAIGFFLKTQPGANQIKIAGWGFMAFFWSTQPNTLFYSEEGDIFNASLCIIGVFVLFYFAYREWLSIKNKEQINCLNWLAGAAALAGSPERDPKPELWRSGSILPPWYTCCRFPGFEHCQTCPS